MSTMDGPWMVTHGGHVIYVTDPDPESICIVDIASHLSKLCRWGGAINVDFKVAEHCYMAYVLALPEDKLVALMHDAHEYITNDIINPVKWYLGQSYEQLVEVVDRAIFTRFPAARPVDEDQVERVRMIDKRLCLTEARDYAHESVFERLRKVPYFAGVQPYPWKMPSTPMIHQQAQMKFLRAALQYVDMDTGRMV